MNETFRDPDLPLAERMADLMGRLTVPEKIALLHQYQPPIDRLGIDAYRTGTEALHGLAWLGQATVFPQAVGLASTWDPELVARVGEATGEEVVAFRHKGAGRNVWAPVVNPLRDPRWGRNEEGYSEDPWLTGIMGEAYARGLRGSAPVMRTAPTLKHFLGYNNETDRCVTSSNLPPRVLHEYELPCYRPALESGAAVAVMPSYNLVNGRPAHLSPLINEILRAWAPDDIHVVSDAYAPGNLTGLQAYHDDAAEAYAHAIKAGLDSFTQDDDRPQDTLDHIADALARGLLTEDDLDLAVRHALSIRFRLGEFDPATPYDHIGEDVVNSPEHQELAREAARRSMVLLHNDGLLPLARTARIAVIGQLGDTLMEDWYSGSLPYAVTARKGLDAAVFCEGVDRIRLAVEDGPELGYFDVFDWGGGALALRSVATGRFLGATEDGQLIADQPGPNGWEVRQTFRWVGRSLRNLSTGRYVGAAGLQEDPLPLTVEVLVNGAEQAVEVARDADVAIVVAGDHPLVNGRETEDRADLALPQAQQAVLKAVAAANPDTVLVISSGYPFTWAGAERAAVWSAHGGQEYGNALADVLFGDAEPEGRLTQTWYRDACELPDLLDYDIISADATYLYYLGTPLYPFGHGLSYTTFDYSGLVVTTTADEVRASVTVTNTGPREGSEVVQFYSRQRVSRVKQPQRKLRRFARVRLAPGESRTVSVAFQIDELAFWDVTRGRFVVESAPHQLMVGRSATDLRLSARFDVAGEVVPPRTGPLDAMDHDDYDAITFVAASRERGEAVKAEADGAWVRFRQVDLKGARSCEIEAGSTEGGVITLRRDDPLGGQVLASFPVPRTDRYEAVLSRSALAEYQGVHDLYVVLENCGITVRGVCFA
ncbi:glycoside hydrolase family 3 C-terminal domain-containing protein [Nonomuraea sp. NPDC050663]|uniref:glycoside hydrolase family 3 protein n=1 Tax=Nonomuraea sp. NPDC050663 TaxID=3364370 RepID=UPI0037B76A60